MAFLPWERRVTTTQLELCTSERSGRAGDRLARSLESVRPERRVALLSLVLIVVSGALLLALPDVTESTRLSPAWLVVVLLVAFATTEVTVFKFTFRRESMAFSLSEIPLAFSLVYLAPGPAIAVRVVGAITIVLLIRVPLFKVALNIGLFAFEVVLAFTVFRGVVRILGSSDTQLVVAAIAATAVCALVSSIIVSLAISQFEGGFRSRVSSELSVAWWLFLVNATLAGMVLGLELISPYLLLISLVPIGLLWYIIKAYGALEQRLRDLDAVHGFTGQVGLSLDPTEIISAGVARTAEILRTDAAAVILFNDDGCGAILKIHGSDGLHLPTGADDENWRSLIMSERATLVSGVELDLLKTSESTVVEIMVAPIRDGSGVIGLLVVGGRTGAGKRFGNDDIIRLQNLAEQLTASLRRGLLHQRIEREARHDRLTGLPNRLSFERSVIDAGATRSSDELLFVIMVDLDRFKEVNDTLGHHAGDELLIEVGERLTAMLGPDDVLARLASDEFAIVGHRPTHADMVEFAWSCVRNVGRPVTLDGLEIVVTASAGVALIDGDHEEGAPLRYADIAMFNAKTQRLGVEVYRDEIDRRTPARLAMLGDLRAAIEGGELRVHLQPKLDLNSGTVVGAEALVRWTHPVRGVVSPAQFVRVAEDTGLIKQLTDVMLHRGIGHLREIHDRGYHLGLAVNLSTHDLLDTKLAQRVEQHLSANRVDASMLTLEITESSLLIDAPRARATINELHEVGVRLSIDDFGTGYSSLSYLRRLPVAELKIDQSFVANLLLDEQDEVIVRSTIDLGHNLGLVVVAEGVENNEVLERLREFGCDIAQGYCISRPLDPGHFNSWLENTNLPSLKADPLDFSRWVDSGEPAEAAPSLD